MNHAKARFEKILNEDSSVKEIFLSVKLFEDGQETHCWEQGYWLTDSEKDAVVADEAALDAIVEAVAVKGEAAYAYYLANPPVVNLQEETPPIQ